MVLAEDTALHVDDLGEIADHRAVAAGPAAAHVGTAEAVERVGGGQTGRQIGVATKACAASIPRSSGRNSASRKVNAVAGMDRRRQRGGEDSKRASDSPCIMHNAFHPPPVAAISRTLVCNRRVRSTIAARRVRSAVVWAVTTSR